MSNELAKKSLSDEQSLIRSVLAGQTSDFEQLVLRYQDMIYNLIKRQVADEASARDLAQETFLRAFRGLKGFKFQASFFTWLTRIALNQTNSYFCSRSFKEKLRNVSFDAREHDSVGHDSRIETGAANQLSQLQLCIAALKPKFRDVLTLCSLEGKTYQEAALILEIPIGTVCSRMNTALTILRDNFARLKAEQKL